MAEGFGTPSHVTPNANPSPALPCPTLLCPTSFKGDYREPVAGQWAVYAAGHSPCLGTSGSHSGHMQFLALYHEVFGLKALVFL